MTTEKDELLRKVAHDLKSPISVLKTYLDTLELEKLHLSNPEFFEAARQSLEKLNKLANAVDESLGYTVTDKEQEQQKQKDILDSMVTGDVLVVDDDAGFRKQWSDYFQNKNENVVVAENGEELLAKKMDYAHIQKAIVDFQFENSNLNGFDVVEFLKQKGVKQVYLCTTLGNDPKIQRRAYELGVSSVLTKPLNFSPLEV